MWVGIKTLNIESNWHHRVPHKFGGNFGERRYGVSDF